MMIEGDFVLPVEESSSGNDAIEVLKNDSSICLVISDFNMADGNASDLYRYIKEQQKSIPFILVSSEDIRDHQAFDFFSNDHPGNGRINKPFSGQELGSVTSKALKEAFESKPENKNKWTPFSENSHFYRVKIEHFKNTSEIFSDTSIKISESKYLKAFNRGESIDDNQIKRYKEKGVEYFYQEKKQFDEYIELKIKALIKQLDNDDLDSSKINLIQLNSIEQIREVVQSLGIRESVVELTEKIADSVTKSLKKNKSMKDLLSSLSANKGFFFEHSHIVNYICASIAEELNWDDKIISKFVFCSLFSDMELTDPKLAIVTSLEDKSFNNLKREEKNLVKSHMDGAILKLDSTYSDFSTDEKNIILNHHERPGGSGFSKGLNEFKIPPLSGVFNLAYDYSKRILLSKSVDDIDGKKILNDMGDGFSKGCFEEPFRALKRVLDSN